jgi:NAD(P)-dependent dehydrogenase (short-subunit alcohol dehydrogenase family)
MYDAYTGSCRSLQHEVHALGRKSIICHADVASECEVDGMFDALRSEFGRLDVVVCNAYESSTRCLYASYYIILAILI